MPWQPSRAWATAAVASNLWRRSRTLRPNLTWWCASCAAANTGPCWACRPPDTRARRPARAPCARGTALAEFCAQLPGNTPVRVWDSTDKVRCLVLPCGSGLQTQVREDAFDNRRLEVGGNDLQLAAAVRAVVHGELKRALHQTSPAHHLTCSKPALQQCRVMAGP
jgi:hypothetical protein